MELTRRLARLRYIYGWRLRYWWLDTPSGLRARLTALILTALTALVVIIVAGVVAFSASPDQRRVAIATWIASLIAGAAASVLCRRKRRGKSAWKK